jgi:hypothetical protein
MKKNMKEKYTLFLLLGKDRRRGRRKGKKRKDRKNE